MFSWFKGNEQTDFADTEEDRKVIDGQIARFKSCREALLATDSQIGLAGGIEGLLYLSGATGFVLNLTLACMLYVYVTQYTFRKQKAEAHAASLGKLVALYHRCLEGKTKPLTENSTFLKLLAIIAPLVETSVLRLDKLALHKSLPLNKEFMGILSQPPHGIHFIQPDANLTLETEADVSLPMPAILPAPLRLLTKTRYLRLFPQATAEMNRALYGYQEQAENISSLRAT